MIVKIKQILESETKTSKAGRPYTITSFLGEDDKMYKNVYGKFEVGQEVEGEWKDSDYGLRFEVAKKESTGGFRGRSPEDQRSIIRQHSQEMALRFLGFCNIENKKEKELLELVFKLADKFEEDANKKVVKEEKTETEINYEEQPF